MSGLGENEMTISAIDESQRKAAKVAGFAGLFTMVIVFLAEFGSFARLIVADNAVETARNILSHERLFRIGIAGFLTYAVGVVVLLTALYVILKPVSAGLALLAAFCRLAYAVLWLLTVINLFTALRLLSGGDYLRVFEVDRLQALASLYLSGSDAYYVGLPFWALASTFCGYLWFQSNYIPRSLAALGVISSAFCVACTLTFYIFPSFDKIVNLWWFDSPMVIFEIALSFWLLFKGIRTPLVD
jgi:hypothetical protein